MDADAALALLRARNRYIRELPSGLWARITLPQVGEVLASGDVPMPVLREIARQAAEGAETNGDGPKDEPVDITAVMERVASSASELQQYRRIMVRRSLRGLGTSQADVEAGEDMEYPYAVIDELAQEDFDQIFAWGDRNEQIDPLPPTPASLT